MRIIDADLDADIAVFLVGCIHKLQHFQKTDIGKDISIISSGILLDQAAEVAAADTEFVCQKIQIQLLVMHMCGHIGYDLCNKLAVAIIESGFLSNRQFGDNAGGTSMQLFGRTAPFQPFVKLHARRINFQIQIQFLKTLAVFFL